MRLERDALRKIRGALDTQILGVAHDWGDADIDQLLARHGGDLEAAIIEMWETAVTAGVASGAGAPTLRPVAVGVDFGLVHEEAVGFARNQAMATYGTINGTTSVALLEAEAAWVDANLGLQNLANAIADHIQSGAHLDDLVAKLEPMIGQNRAEMIASTETTRAYAEGNRQAWAAVEAETGLVIRRRVVTANDERVCPICAPLGGIGFDADGAEPTSIARQQAEGETAGLYEDFIHPGGHADAGSFRGQAFDSPPFHVRCRCGVVPVVVR